MNSLPSFGRLNSSISFAFLRSLAALVLCEAVPDASSTSESDQSIWSRKAHRTFLPIDAFIHRAFRYDFGAIHWVDILSRASIPLLFWILEGISLLLLVTRGIPNPEENENESQVQSLGLVRLCSTIKLFPHQSNWSFVLLAERNLANWSLKSSSQIGPGPRSPLSTGFQQEVLFRSILSTYESSGLHLIYIFELFLNLKGSHSVASADSTYGFRSCRCGYLYCIHFVSDSILAFVPPHFLSLG